jgi:cell division protein FtsB
MSKRLKMTPFARFFLVMIVLAPLAYIGASYYNGEDGIQNLKNLLGIGKEKTTVTVPVKEMGVDDSATVSLQEQIDSLRDRVEQLERENEELKQKLDSRDKEIRTLKDRMGQIN